MDSRDKGYILKCESCGSLLNFAGMETGMGIYITVHPCVHCSVPKSFTVRAYTPEEPHEHAQDDGAASDAPSPTSNQEEPHAEPDPDHCPPA